jgi:hypothetical protein
VRSLWPLSADTNRCKSISYVGVRTCGCDATACPQVSPAYQQGSRYMMLWVGFAGLSPSLLAGCWCGAEGPGPCRMEIVCFAAVHVAVLSTVLCGACPFVVDIFPEHKCCELFILLCRYSWVACEAVSKQSEAKQTQLLLGGACGLRRPKACPGSERQMVSECRLRTAAGHTQQMQQANSR